MKPTLVKRRIAFEDEPVDEEFLDVSGGHAAMVSYGRSPKVSGKFRVERVQVKIEGRTFEFRTRYCCVAAANQAASAIAAIDLDGLLTGDPATMGFVEVT